MQKGNRGKQREQGESGGKIGPPFLLFLDEPLLWLVLTQQKMRYVTPTEETVKAMVAWGWTVELDSARAVSKAQIKRKVSKLVLVSLVNICYWNYG